MNKPTKPNITIPEAFAIDGIKTDFTNEKLQNGYDRLQPDVLPGDCLNKFIDDTYKASNYALNLGDYVLGKDMITNCTLEAPNGIISYNGANLTVHNGLKILIPNKKNPNKTLKNIEHTVSNDITININNIDTVEGEHYVFVSNTDNILYILKSAVFFQEEEPINGVTLGNGYYVWINPSVPEIKVSLKSPTWNDYTGALIGVVNITGNGTSATISNAISFNATTLLNRIDRFEITRWGYPSDKYINLTLGASGDEYIAPTNGYFFLRKFASAAHQFMNMSNIDAFGIGDNAQAYTNLQSCWIWVPVKKGDRVQINYTFGGNTELFYFIYSEGDK